MPGPWKWRRWEIQSLWKWGVSAPSFMKIPVLLSEPVAAPGCRYRPAASEQTSWLWLHIKSHLSERSWPAWLLNSERRVLNSVVSFGRRQEGLSGFCPLATALQPWAGRTWNCGLKPGGEQINRQTILLQRLFWTLLLHTCLCLWQLTSTPQYLSCPRFHRHNCAVHMVRASAPESSSEEPLGSHFS